MRYTIKYEMITDIAANIGIVADKEGAVVLAFGFKDLGSDKVDCALRMTTPHEELFMQFTTDKPEGYDGNASKVRIKASLLSAVLGNLAGQKADIFFDITENGCVIGVAGKAQVPVPVLSESAEAMAPGKAMLCIALSGKDFMDFLRKGLLCSSEENSDRGLNNAVMVINTETGEITGASTDQYRMGYAVMKGKISPNRNNPEAEAAALKDYCEKTGVDPKELPVVLPRQTVEHIKSLVGSTDAFRMVVDDRHVTLVLGGNRALYKAVQGATQPMGVSMMRQLVDCEVGIKASLDCDELEKAVSFMNAMADATGGGASSSPIRLSIKDGHLLAEGTKSEDLRSSVKVDSSGDESVSVLVNGKFVKTVLSFMKKGGVVVGLTDSRVPMVTFANGTISKGEDGSGKIALLGTKEIETVTVSDDDATDEAEAESSED